MARVRRTRGIKVKRQLGLWRQIQTKRHLKDLVISESIIKMELQRRVVEL
jgi:hypothetical protein